MTRAREYRWMTVDPDAALSGSPDHLGAVKKLANELRTSFNLARILTLRGIDTIEKARVFFSPELGDLHDPYLMTGMNTAVERILEAISKKQKITVYGDYDVDGTNGTALLYTFLKSVDADAMYYIPERLKEGYGLSEAGVRKAKDLGTALLVSVDCGVTAVEQVALANQLGMDVVICDHHEPGPILPPAKAILNPLQPGCRYPFKYLSGCGVALKLVQALLSAEEIQTRLGGSSVDGLAQYLDLAALATTADIVPLVGENRTIVRLGIELINTSPRPGIQALVASAGLTPGKINSGNIVFILAPRINAVGRLGDARRAVELLISRSPDQASDLARVLEEENKARRKLDEDTFEEARNLVEETHNLETDNVIVLHKNDWHPGVIGIVASRLVERYNRPAVMLTTVEGVAKGSARSISGFDIYQALNHCQDTLIQFGGHKYAAGLTVDTSRIEDFKTAFGTVARQTLAKELLTPEIRIDGELSLAEVTPEFLSVLADFAPFGPGNSTPIFAVRKAVLYGTPRIVGTNHLKFKVKHSGRVMDAIGFKMGEHLSRLQANGRGIDIACSVEENEYAGDVQPQLKVRDLKFS